MKKTLTTCDIASELKQDNNANWSHAGAMALAEYLEELEEQTGEEMELDVVAIRCDFAEYSSLEEWAEEYFGYDLEKCVEEGDLRGTDDRHIRDHIESNGTLIEFGGGIIVSSF